MAISTGIVKLQGTIQGISFYERKGKLCARKAGGPSKEKIASSEKCQRTRENNAEFEGAVAASKALRTGLGSFTMKFADWNLSGRLNGVFKKAADRATGIRGQRPIEILPNKDLLEGFNLNKEMAFDGVFKAPFTSSVNALRNEVTITIPDIDIRKAIDAPGGATHFRIVNAITVLPKFVFDPLSKKYLRADGTYDITRGYVYSDFISLSGNAGSVTNITATLSGAPVIDFESGLIACVGIEFYQMVNGKQFPLKGLACMKVSKIY
jgi:hypothetical protein